MIVAVSGDIVVNLKDDSSWPDRRCFTSEKK